MSPAFKKRSGGIQDEKIQADNRVHFNSGSDPSGYLYCPGVYFEPNERNFNIRDCGQLPEFQDTDIQRDSQILK